MNFHNLSLEELARMASTRSEARQYIVDNACDIIEECADTADRDDYDPAGCWDDGYNEGKGATLRGLSETYSNEVLEWLARVPEMALAGDGDLAELEALLGALHAEFEDEAE